MHELTTPRLRLRSWRDQDRDAFAAMNADPIVMADLGGPISRELSDAKLDRYSAAFADHDFGRWLIERIADDGEPEYLGYAGVMPVTDEHPVGAHYEIGWRLRHEAWGQGLQPKPLRPRSATSSFAAVSQRYSPTRLRTTTAHAP